jgi:hypothetical protein
MEEARRLGRPLRAATTPEWMAESRGRGEMRILQGERSFQRGSAKGTVNPQLEGAEFPNVPPWRFAYYGGSPAAFAARLERGRVWGNNGAVITPDHVLLSDVSREWISAPEEHSVFQQLLMPPLLRTEESVAVLDAVGGENYFHWMVDVLPRLELIRKSGWAVDKYVVRAQRRGFHQETLELLGLTSDRLYDSHPDFHLEARQLVVPSRTYEASWAYEFLRREFLPLARQRREERNYGVRLFISRQRADCRRLLNEPEVAAYLQEVGFQIVCLEDMTVLEQAALFSAASLIVAPHGAGLTNLVFCEPQTQVVEIFSPRFFNGCFYNLSNNVDIDYHYLIGTSGHRPSRYEGSSWYYPGLDDIQVDLGSLTAVVQSLIETRRSQG